MIYLIIYIVGFIVTLLLFKFFGKKIGFDYSGPKTYVNYDDWDSNTSAYTCFSIFWFVTVPIITIFGLWYCLTLLTGKIIKD